MLANDNTQGKTYTDYLNTFNSNDKSGIVSRVMRRTRLMLKNSEKLFKAMKEDFNFALGDQWSDEDRQQLEDEGRPCLTFNKIEPLINLVGGWQRENSPRIRIFPEGGEDRLFSEIGDKCVNAVDKWSHLNYKLDHQFDDGLICGKGISEMAMSYEDDLINGDLIFRNRTPFEVVFDPDSTEYDKSDADDATKICKFTRLKLKKMFPKKVKEIDNIKEDIMGFFSLAGITKEGDSDNYQLDKEDDQLNDLTADHDTRESPDQKLYLFEYWYKKYTQKFALVNVLEKKMEVYDSQEEAEKRTKEIYKQIDQEYKQALSEYELMKAASPDAPMPVKQDYDIQIYERTVPEMWYCAVCGGALLQEPELSPFEPHYSGYPFFEYLASYVPSAPKQVLKIKGITRNIKDPNREINKSRSQFLHILNTNANSGWVGDDDALTTEGWKDLEKLGSTPGVTIKKKKGSELKRIEPAAPSMANIMRGDKGEDDIKQISGINPDAMAIQDKTTSGKAISLRIKQALTILAKYFRNFRYTKELIGNAIYCLLPEVFDKDTLRKILGEEFMEKNKIDDGYLIAFLQRVRDKKYDVRITEADNTATMRQETFEQLLDLSEKYPNMLPPDLIIEYSNIPNSAELIERMREHMDKMAGQQEKQG